MKNAIESFISLIRELHPDLENACLNGNCYKFHLLLKSVYKEAIPYYNNDHVISKIRDTYYDVTGRVSGKGYLDMRTERLWMRKAHRWKYENK